jgi:hypothetical protein
MSVLLAVAWVREVKPVPVARPTRELGVGVPTVAVVGVMVLYTSLTFCTGLANILIRAIITTTVKDFSAACRMDSCLM